MLTIEEKPWKKPQPRKLTPPGIEPGHPRREATMLPFGHSGGLCHLKCMHCYDDDGCVLCLGATRLFPCGGSGEEWGIEKCRILMDKSLCKFTAMEQAAACVPINQRDRFRSPVRTSFLGEVFSDSVYRLSYLYCLGDGPGIELITHLGRPSMYLCGPKSMRSRVNSLFRQVVTL